MADQISNYELPFTAASHACVAEFEEAVESYLAARPDTMVLVERLIERDPDMIMAVCFRGYLLRLAAHPKLAGAIAACLERVQELVDQKLANPRERQHAHALQLWCADRADDALEVLEDLLKQQPLDMLALRIAHYLHFYNGRGEDMRDSTARVLDAWPQQHAHYDYLLGMHAFGLEESAQYEPAMEFGQRAVAANPADIWATHAVAHVYQMQGRHTEGLDWLDGLRDQWENTNNFRNHVVWHGALHYIGIGQPDEALKVYDDLLAETIADDFYLDVCNNAALLWRLQFLGLDIGGRWDAMVELCAKHAHDKELVFASLHYLIPLAVTGADEAGELLQTLRAWGASDTEQGSVCAGVGIALAQAIVQAPENPEQAAETLAQHRADMYLVGGSKAQRDLFRLLSDDVATRANRSDLLTTAS
jgi:tetratricopeptide (TPR) repeat protein